jgi:hypothetical protein
VSDSREVYCEVGGGVKDVKRWLLPGRAWYCAFFVIGSAPGCDDGKDSDSRGSDAAVDARACEANQFVGDPGIVAALADCTTMAGDLVFTGNDLVNIELPKLVRVDGSFSVWGNPDVTHIALPRLASVGGYFLVEANDILASVDCPALDSVNERAVMHIADFSISGNPRLPTCQAYAIRDQLLAHEFMGSFKVTDNLGTCPP